jgi:hypothetical protein
VLYHAFALKGRDGGVAAARANPADLLRVLADQLNHFAGGPDDEGDPLLRVDLGRVEAPDEETATRLATDRQFVADEYLGACDTGAGAPATGTTDQF